MAPKGGNAKKESGRSKKAENEAKKAAAADAEREHKEAEKWSDGPKGSKSSKEDKEEKRKAELARKAENARLLAEEEASVSSKPKAGAKKAAAKKVKPAGPGAIAAGGGPEAVSGGDVTDKAKDEHLEEPEHFAATGIDNAIDLLEVVTAKMDKASVGTQAAGLERHPERRFKAAFEAYKEREMPNVRADHPGLRLQQYQEMLYKQFQKSPENPFNQVTVAYDAGKEERVDALKQKHAVIEERHRA